MRSKSLNLTPYRIRGTPRFQNIPDTRTKG